MSAPLCKSMRRAIVREANRRNLPVWAVLILLGVSHADA
jgi:hypothetical protein